MPDPGMHTCPRNGCHLEVPNEQFACFRDWAELSPRTRSEIVRTRGRHVLDPERRTAFRMADADWGRW